MNFIFIIEPPHFARHLRKCLNHHQFEGAGSVVEGYNQTTKISRSDDLRLLPMKSMVYERKSQTVAKLRQWIFNVTARIRNDPEVLRRATLSFLQRSRSCLLNGGNHCSRTGRLKILIISEIAFFELFSLQLKTPITPLIIDNQ